MQSLFPGLWNAPNLHPFFVHLPVATVPLSLMFLVIGVVAKRNTLFGFGCLLLYIGIVGLIASVVSGLWAANDMGHDSPGHGLVHTHRDYMYVATAIGVASGVIAYYVQKRSTVAKQWILVAVVGVLTAVMSLGADRGAELVFRYGIGTGNEIPPDVHNHSHDGHDEHEH